MHTPRITAITPMKNEGPYILEWVAYHRLIGINDFLVFTNDCDDGTDLILERLDDLGLVRHAPNPSQLIEAPRHHIQLMRYVNLMPRLRRSDWFINLDADEFVNVHAGGRRLPDLFAALGDADILTLSLLTFGCDGVEGLTDRAPLVTDQFLRREPVTEPSFAVKSFVRGDADIKRISNNSPEVTDAARARLRWLNGNGDPLPPEVTKIQTKALKTEWSAFDLVQINHYAVRSMDGFVVQRDRGSANPMKRGAGAEEGLDTPAAIKYWRRFNRNEVADHSIPFRDELTKAVNGLLADPELRALHDRAVAWHRERVATLCTDPDYATLRARIARIHERTMKTETVTKTLDADAA